MFVCLVLNGTSTQDGSVCADCGRVKPTQLAKDDQRDTMHNSQYVTQCNTVHNKTLRLQKCNNRLSYRMTFLLKYYVSAFTKTKSDHTLPIRYNNFTRWDAVLRHAQDIVRQFTLLYIAQCQDKKKWILSHFFPVYCFRATVCASTRDNRYNCALPTRILQLELAQHEVNNVRMGDRVKWTCLTWFNIYQQWLLCRKRPPGRDTGNGDWGQPPINNALYRGSVLKNACQYVTWER